MKTPHVADISPHWAPIVIVEDDPNDAYLTYQAIQSAQIKNPIVTCRDAEEARRLLAGERARTPALLLLDINLNRGESGLDFLAWLRVQGGLLGSTPALILTGSDHPRDLLIADRLRVMRYLTKPVHHEQLVGAVQSLGLRFATNLATGDVGFRLLERT